ncbi:MAG: Hsp20/alpha crystallin family protein [Bacteroidota bacterium]
MAKLRICCQVKEVSRMTNLILQNDAGRELQSLLKIFLKHINYKKTGGFMSNKTLTRFSGRTPSVFDDFFKPWNDWFDSGNTFERTLKVPAVNITEHKDEYLVSLAAPGLKKDDFNIDVDGNILTVSSQKEENKEEKEKTFTRKEYSYSSFSRSFTLPEEINKEKIDAKYEDGVLKISLPRKEEAKKVTAKTIAVK